MTTVGGKPVLEKVNVMFIDVLSRNGPKGGSLGQWSSHFIILSPTQGSCGATNADAVLGGPEKSRL
jgi:hypothetical protein